MPHHRDLSNHRFEQAEICLKSAKTLLAADDYKGSANRSYYAVFHSMRSVLALENRDFKSHTALISHFRNMYIKTKIFDEKLSDIVTVLFRVRNQSDYDYFYVISKEDVINQIELTEFFINEVCKFLRTAD